MDSPEDSVRWFISERTGIAADEIELTTDIGRDLGVAGDDGVELMEAFAQRFSVDLTGFDCVEYFGSEAGCSPLLWLLGRLFFPEKLRLTPLPVSRLVEAAKAGRWLG